MISVIDMWYLFELFDWCYVLIQVFMCDDFDWLLLVDLSIMQVFVMQLGVIVVQNGGFGLFVLVSICGLLVSQVVVFIDGIWIGLLIIGIVLWVDLLIDVFECVEVIFGLVVVLFGNNVMGGVV